MKLVELFTQRAIIDELIQRKIDEIEIWIRENVHLNNVQFTVYDRRETFYINVADIEMEDETKEAIVKTVFRDLFVISNFQINNKTNLFESYCDSKKKEVLGVANNLIEKWKER